MAITLPTTKTLTCKALNSMTIFLHGKKKIGKTTWASGFEDALFLQTEPCHGISDLYQLTIENWSDFEEAVAEISAGNHRFKTIVIDTINNLYGFVCNAICEEYRLKHISDFKQHGKGYSLAGSRLYEYLLKLANLPYGLILIGHSVEVEIETSKEKYKKTVPQLPEKMAGQILGMSDLILFADIREETDANGRTRFRHVIRTKPSKYFEAGDATGLLPATLDLDYDSFVEAYQEGFERLKNDTHPKQQPPMSVITTPLEEKTMKATGK